MIAECRSITRYRKPRDLPHTPKDIEYHRPANTWVDSSYSFIPMSELSDKHLKNAIDYARDNNMGQVIIRELEAEAFKRGLRS